MKCFQKVHLIGDFYIVYEADEKFVLFQLILQVVFLLYEYTGVCVGVRCMEQSAGYTFEGAADKRHEGLRDKPGKGRPCLKNEILTKEGNVPYIK